MPYLIDGNNLCGAARDRRLGLPIGEAEMVHTLAEFASRRRCFLTVVFDGPATGRRGAADGGKAGRVTVRYSGSKRSADDWILDHAGGFADPRAITLVTSDRALASRARSLGCRVVGCRQFADAVHRAAARGGAGGLEAGDEKPLAADVEDWERYFAGED